MALSQGSSEVGRRPAKNVGAATTTASGSLGKALLLVLWLVWAGLLFGGFVFGTLSEDENYRIGVTSRIGSSAVLVVAGLVGFALWRRTTAGSAALLIAVGMALGFLGDLFNAGLLDRLIPLEDPTLGGIGAFGLGHVAYIAACLIIARRAGLTSTGARYASLAVWELLGIVGWFAVVYWGAEMTLVRWMALPYTLLLAGTAGLMTGLAVGNRRLVPLAFGGALFLVSDLILAFRLFRGSFYMAGDAVWLTYGPGQMLIVFSIGSIAAVMMSSEAPSQATGNRGSNSLAPDCS